MKVAGRKFNNLKYADDTTLMAESEEELNSLLMRVKEKSEEANLKLNMPKTKILASFWQIEGEESGNSDNFYLLGLQNHCRW